MRSSKKLMTRLLPTFLALMGMLLVACGGTSTTTTTTSGKATPDKQVLNMPFLNGTSDIKTFDPALSTDANSIAAIDLVFTGLVQFDDKLQVQPQLASSYSLSSDGLTWTFTLKPNLKFSDGTPLTSQDVVYTINRVLLPATNSPVGYYLSLLNDYDKISSGKIPTLIGDSLLTPDANTVVIKISRPAAYFLQTLAYNTSYVVEKKLIDKYGTKWTDHLDEGGGAGPWKVVSYSHTKGIDYVPNPYYYGTKPQLQHLSILFYADQNGMYRAYQANQLDFTFVPPANVASERSSQGFREVNVLVIRYISMHYLAKPFDNIKIRQAFALALNKDQIVHSALRDTETPSNHIIPSGMPGYYPALTGPAGVASTAGDAAKAQQLLKEGMQEAGYASVSALPPITLTFYPRNQNFK